MKHLHIKELFFFVSIIVLGAISFFMMKPFLGIIVMALVIVEVFSPVYYFILKRIKSQTLSSILSTLLVLTVVIIPLTLVLLVALNQALSIKDTVQNYVIENRLLEDNGAELTRRINNTLTSLSINYHIESIDYKGAALSIAGEIVGGASSVVNFLKDFVNVIIAITFLIYTMIYLFREHGNLRNIFKKLSPLDDEFDDLFIEKFNSIARSVVKGSLIIGIVQGALGGLAFWVLGVDAPLFWTLVMIFFATIPLGSGFVWAPAAIILALSGRVPAGIALMLWGILVISTVDNFLRPKLLEKDTNLHPLVSFFSVLGGIYLFGPLGIIYGPLVVILFLSLYEVYRHKYKLVGSRNGELV